MKPGDYKNELKKIEEDYRKEKTKLHIRYAKACNPYKVGDVISDHCDTIKIEKITFTMASSDFPCCLYSGPKLKKDGSSYKNNSYSRIHQTNIVKG
jgi:hypothetical protein